MPAPFPIAQDGQALNLPPTGFPLYVGRRQPRVVTSDVWAFLRHKAVSSLPKEKQKEAVAFIEQAFEFFEAAANPRIGSRPLLYYYSFLNLAKVLLLIRKVRLPLKLGHGILDSRANVRTRLRLQGQTVRVVKCAHDHSELFPEFVKVFGDEIRRPQEIKVVGLLRQMPSIHRTFCRVTGEKASFLPLKKVEVLRRHGHVFTRIILNNEDSDVRSVLPKLRARRAFKRVFHQVCPQSADSHEIWFESVARPGIRRGVDTAIVKLAGDIQDIGVWTILTSQGNRYYLSSISPGKMLPPLASVYAVMFYLGSITRYKPYDFDRIVSHKYSWLVNEFLRTQPAQFLYGLASHVACVDVVRPFASMD